MKRIIYIETDASNLQRLGKNNFIGKCSAMVCNRPIAEQKQRCQSRGIVIGIENTQKTMFPAAKHLRSHIL